MGEAEPVKTAAGCAGRRRHLPAVLHSTSAGASMPLTRHYLYFKSGHWR
uniref:Uncharacterized protein n=1 Tax=Klebsiella pneumoniae TaxID=573 RepID=A0A6M6A270_KLEPN|nr:hypothetical protein [Klebsiella pneumoniae]